MTLIAFTGLKGSGKDTAASVFVGAGWVHVKMAGALKDMLRSLLAYQGVNTFRIERMLEGDLKEARSPYLGGRSPRYAMQELGTAWGRDIMADELWTNVTKARCVLLRNQGKSVVISDVRFPNEVGMVHDLGGNVIRIDRKGVETTDTHQSETLIQSLYVDRVIRNDAPSVEDFRADIMAQMRNDLRGAA